MITLQNGALRVQIAEHGAELCGLSDLAGGAELLWDAGPAWPRHSPVLFPIIGGLKDNSYLLDGGRYTLPPHGFARDLPFRVERRDGQSAELVLEDSGATRGAYPFAFALSVSYTLRGRALDIGWRVHNRSARPMPFSIGAHTGFRLHGGIDGYALAFDREVPLLVHRVRGRLVEREESWIPGHEGARAGALTLSRGLFSRDALVFTQGINSAVLRDTRGRVPDIAVSFPGFPAVAFWTPPAAEHPEFLCIEPWYGINDFVDGEPQDMARKHLVQTAQPDAVWTASHRITVGGAA